MPYFQLFIDIDTDAAIALEACLERLGALSVTFHDRGDEPILEPAPGEAPLWRQMRVTALFDATAVSAEQLHPALCREMGWADVPGWGVEAVPERDWERAWLDAFQPMRFGQRLWVCPTTAPAPEQSDAVVLWLDPGLAFGTGTHPTTALCLEWLEQQNLAGQCVIDYGCGSGILAVAALKLGAARCVAVDNDPQALRATQENAQRNDVADRLDVRSSEAAAPAPGGVLVANILSKTLCRLAPELMACLSPGGAFALAGILDDQAEAVAEAYRPYAELAPAWQSEEWVLLHGRRRQG